MKLLFTIFIFILYYQVQAQSFTGIVHYKREGVSYNSSGRSYIVNALTLKSDSSFKLQYLTFANKRERKNCILSSVEINKGYWFKSGDTIKCVISEPLSLENKTEKFLIGRHKLYYFSSPSTTNFLKKQKIKYPWKRIETPNSDKLFKLKN